MVIYFQYGNDLVRSFVWLFCLKEQFKYGMKGIGWMGHKFIDY